MVLNQSDAMSVAKSATTTITAVLLIASLVHGQNFDGDRCFHNGQSKNGICKNIAECPSAILELTTLKKMPQTCGFVGTAPIVCCPVEEEVTTTTTTEAPKIVEKGPTGIGAKSYQKCREYGKEVFQTYPVPTLSDLKKNRTVDECGFKYVKLIVGGIPAKGKEFPHMTAIGYDTPDGDKVYVCGGSLISPNYVLTAGHCLSTRENGVAKYARVGDLQLDSKSDDAEPQEQIIIERIPHPDYKPPSQYNDIALLKVEKPFELTAYVRPICLNIESNIPDEKAMASGWGTTSYLGSTSENLLKVTLDFFTHDECKRSYQVSARKLARGIEDATQMCAGSRVEQKDTCQGDSGGPLQIYNEDVYCMYTLVGVTSFGKACGIARTPGIYSRVSHYIPWIEDIVWP